MHHYNIFALFVGLLLIFFMFFAFFFAQTKTIVAGSTASSIDALWDTHHSRYLSEAGLSRHSGIFSYFGILQYWCLTFLNIYFRSPL